MRSGGAAPEGADAGELIAQALAAVAPRTEGAKETSTEAVSSGGQYAGRGVPKAQTPAGGGGVVEPSGGRAKGEGVEEWMWEWREWRQVAPGEPCPAGLAYRMDLHAGTSWARLPANLRARLDAAEAARGGGADERPLAPFPPRPETGRRGVRKRRKWRTRRHTGPASRRWPSCLRTTPGPTSTPAWTRTRPTSRCGPCPLRCRPLPWGAVSGGLLQVPCGRGRPQAPPHGHGAAGGRDAGERPGAL